MVFWFIYKCFYDNVWIVDVREGIEREYYLLWFVECFKKVYDVELFEIIVRNEIIRRWRNYGGCCGDKFKMRVIIFNCVCDLFVRCFVSNSM